MGSALSDCVINTTINANQRGQQGGRALGAGRRRKDIESIVLS